MTTKTEVVVLLGNTAVGKTSIIRYYMSENHMNYVPLSDSPTTLAAKVNIKNVTSENNGECKAKIWDTAGQERYQSLTKLYLKGADGFIIVMDLTDEDSLEGARFWLEEVRD